jgi:hypothetical protein
MGIDDDLAAIEAAMTERVTGGQTTRVRDRGREVEMAKVSEGEINRRRDELTAQRDGTPRRASRRVSF